MSTFTLKLIAIIVMLIDHTGAILISPETHPDLYVLTRSIGRLAFPIFVFLIVEGFYHTKNVKKYLIRLGSFALISEIPFDLAFYKERFNVDFITDFRYFLDNSSDTEHLNRIIERLVSYQNVFFTLFLGLLLITLIDQVEKRLSKQVYMNILISNVIDAVLTIGFCAIAFLLMTDYDYAGILLITAFYLFRGSKAMLAISTLIVFGTSSRFDLFQQTGNLLYIIGILAAFAIIPIAFYNGKKGKDIKYLFYIFYPTHLMVLFLISYLI